MALWGGPSVPPCAFLWNTVTVYTLKSSDYLVVTEICRGPSESPECPSPKDVVSAGCIGSQDLALPAMSPAPGRSSLDDR